MRLMALLSFQAETSMKRIVLACDGTWNTPDQRDKEERERLWAYVLRQVRALRAGEKLDGFRPGKRKPTNVVKLIRAVLPCDAAGVVQISFYDKGVGTHWGISKWVEGATGYGVSRNIIETYQFLCLNYQAGDEIFIFGFSRGAFTARSLVALLTKVGVLPKAHIFYSPEAYKLYRTQADAAEFRKEHECLDVTIRFLGVFDTVGALGIPVGVLNIFTRRLYRFHDVSLSPIVEHAFHALALDERRKQFAPTLWDPDQRVPVERMEQVWYAGVHSNIGGGYDPDGLANIPLHSMKNRAQSLKLAFDEAFLANYKPNPAGEMRQSRKGIYRLTRKLCRPVLKTPHGNERIHETVGEREDRAVPSYKPQNPGYRRPS
ncbi:DUF2235 domain-containing protein [Dyella nitratireducens]|uniref:T6SS Phospholipase effector Tle1-like catalytic domain-containing protein n=1 Tax=Dyella nitratireducens TaxID=1849580 RepID=A0ABQ1GB92_9GAMM|nr:DUF2235 domain-containing protein [Dyella nitratireducens]GGA40158.1 hypothetical protein GCM10010981_31770 [Dyella nitratireducens]GLQ40535.1 hypothetical protein GCM10007902_03840 [Dyella nitratireducens]